LFREQNSAIYYLHLHVLSTQRDGIYEHQSPAVKLLHYIRRRGIIRALNIIARLFSYSGQLFCSLLNCWWYIQGIWWFWI